MDNLLLVDANTLEVRGLFLSYRSSEWRGLSESEKREMKLSFADDGEFW